MEKVYKYKVFDINLGEMKFVESYATQLFINNIEGSEILYETVIEVELKNLDGDGKFIFQK